MQNAGAVQQRVLRLGSLDIGERGIACLYVCPGMAHQPDGAHMQEHRLAPRPRIVDSFPAPAHGIVQVCPVALYIMQRRPVREIRFDPAAGRAHRYPDAIIFTQEDDRHRQMLIGGPTGRIERPLRRRMVRRRIAEGAQDHRIMRQDSVLKLQPLCHPQGMRRAHGLRQVRGDGAGLWGNEGIGTAQYLMPATRDRIFGRGRKGQCHIIERGQAAELLLPLDQERSITIMQKRHIGVPRRRRHCCGAFMAGTADRIKCLPLRPPRPQIEMAAHDLAVEQIDQLMRRNGQRRRIAALCRKVLCGDAAHKGFVDDGGTVKHSQGL